MNRAFFLFFIVLSCHMSAQLLKPGFDKSEYIQTLKINYKAHIPVSEWDKNKTLSSPENFNFVYRSPVVAFDNIWDLWIHKSEKIAVIAVQGSVQTEASFLANLYAAMIPAQGELQLDDQFLFKYKLAENPRAAVQVGWFVAMAYLSKTIEAKIDSCYKAGIKDFILTGHSQGGGITFMLNAYLENLKLSKKLPQDISFKTYCSAGPKPGNLFFAYDYEHITAGGWAYNVVNTADWVPDVPFSVQTVNDFTAVNPFQGAKAMIKKQKFPANVALKYAYNQLSKPSFKAQKNYEKYLGKMVSKAVKKQIPNFNTPEYFQSNYYVRTGNTVVLYADEEYFKLFSNESDNPNIWQHHLPQQYLFLAEKLK
ncbi:lipase family protein [Chryseobacterium sp. 09-1422]|uniref:Lipase family protein n=1 Tax=Chryseobacterium kimseyorum TaxID=2984028 RepID=A0ABT3HU50_9FLAO|nr:lipase family protein [Chryseobacterium kimseyorum]MCW3167317.1 lipase family protein [Chryseobacterium kimseyorum]